MKYNNLTLDMITEHFNNFFNKREEKMLLPFTVRITMSNSIFYVEIEGKPKIITGIGGFINFLSMVNEENINIIVNNELYIKEQKEKFIKNVKETYKK